MKKRSLIIVIVITLLTAIIALGCGTEEVASTFVPDPYTDFNGIDPKSVVEVDDYVTLDGVLDEDIWVNSKTSVYIAGATTDQVTKEPINVEKYGERSATVYSYIGEKAVYFAFDVTDQNLYYDFYSPQGQNTGVEIYIAKYDQGSFTKGAYSIRVNPTGQAKSTFYKIYEPKYYDGIPSRNETSSPLQWREKYDNLGYVDAVAKVDGTVMYSTSIEDYDVKNNNGYVIEIAMDKSIIGGQDATSFTYTAAFCQARGFGETRLNNTFIPNTSYLTPSTWKLVTNDGHIDDKEAYIDATVKCDEEIATIDGVLDDKLWENAVGRTVIGDKKRSGNAGETENVTMTTYAVTTEKGVYLGIESNDAYVYFHGNDVHPKYNTGAEIGVAVGKTTSVTAKHVRQIRLNVGGKGKRYFGKDNSGSGYAYVEGYFPMLMASTIVDGELNTSTAKGWVGELFIPWTSFTMEENDYRDGVAVFVNGYRGYEDPNNSYYFTGMAGNVFGVETNPQETWFLFENGKPVYDFDVDDIVVDSDDIVNGYYEKTVTVKISDTVVNRVGYKEVFPVAKNGTFGFDEVDGVIVTDNGDGTYLVKIPVSSAESFIDKQAIPFNANGLQTSVNVEVKTCYVDADGRNLFVIGEKDGYYSFLVTVTADELGETPIEGIEFDVEFEVDEKASGVYLFKMPKAIVEEKQVHEITMFFTLNGQEIADTFTLYYDAWSEEELDKVLSYLDFNGNIVDAKGNTVTAGTGSTPTYVIGTNGQGVALQNPVNTSAVKKNVNVEKSLGTSDFTLAFDVKLDSNAIGSGNTAAQYELFSSGANIDSGNDTVQISAYDHGRQSIGFRIQLGKPDGKRERYISYYFYDMGVPVNEWFNFMIKVDRDYTGTTDTEEKVAVSLYINGEFRQTNIMMIDKVNGEAQSLGNGNLALGGDYWAFNSGQRKLQMDNFLLYDGFLSDKQIADVVASVK